MNRSALSTFSLATAVAVMIFGYATPAYAEKPDCDQDPSHPSCKTDGGADGAAFNVDIGVLGELQGGSGDNPWLQGFGGKKSIGLNDASPTGLDVGTLTGVGMFTGLDARCFPGDFMPPDPVHGSPDELHQAIVKSGKKGRAEASFWFHGATKNGMVRVLYVLTLFGVFDGDVEFPGEATLLMSTWELKVENEGKEIKSISCQGAGDDSVTIDVTIDVT